MFWISLSAIVAAYLIFKLGALTVAFVFMSAALKVTLLVILALTCLLVWHWYRGRRWRRI